MGLRGSLLNIMEVATNFGGSFIHGKRFVLILTKNGLGRILGVFSHTHLVTLAQMHFFINSKLEQPAGTKGNKTLEQSFLSE
jgi:hypothetical protein